MSKMSLEEATLKALYDELDDSKEVTNVDGIIDDVLVITDPEISGDEYDEIIERAQELVEDTPEGDIPLDEDYLGQYAQTCPLCGATFVTEEILEPGATCPICLDVPEAFVMKGKLEAEDKVAADNGLVDEEAENEEMEAADVNEEIENETFEDNDEDLEALEKELASVQLSGNKLTEGFEKCQATLPLDNYHSMGIIVSENGETVQYMYSNDDEKVYESEIEYDEEGNPFFKDEEGTVWNISDFMRVDYMKESKEVKEESKFLKGDKFKNKEGAVLIVDEVDAEGRPQFYIYNPETDKRGDMLSTDSFETLEKILSDNHYTKMEEDINWETKGKENDEIELPSTQDGTAKEEIEAMLDRAYTRALEKPLEESTDEEVEDIHTRIENAESIEEIQDIIYTIEDNDLETEAMLAYQQCLEDGDDLEAVKDFVIVTIEDNAKYEESLEEDIEKKEELFIPDYEHVQEWTDKQVAEWIVDNFKEITHRDIEDVYNRPTEEDEETPLFKDEVIDETAPAIDDMISKLGFNGKRREEILYAIDDCLVAHRNDNPAPVFNEEEKVEEDKSALEKSMDALDEIERLANGDVELLKIGQEMGLIDFKKYLQDKGLLKEDIQEEIEEVASLIDIQDLEACGDALNKLYDAAVGGESDFLNANYRDELAQLCDRLDKILQTAKETRKGIEE